MIIKEIYDFMNLRLSEVPFHNKGLANSRFAENPLSKCDNSPLEHTLLIELNTGMDEYVEISVQAEIPVEEMKARVDFLVTDNISGQRFVIECDSREWHSTNPDKVESDKIRDTLLTAGDFVVMRFVGRDIYHRSKWCLNNIKKTINLYRAKLSPKSFLCQEGAELDMDTASRILLKKYFTFNRTAGLRGKIEASVSEKYDRIKGSCQKIFSANHSLSCFLKCQASPEVIISGETPGWGVLCASGGKSIICLNPRLETQSMEFIYEILTFLRIYGSLEGKIPLNPPFSKGEKLNEETITAEYVKLFGISAQAICPRCRSELKDKSACQICREDLSPKSLSAISASLEIPRML